MSPTDAPAGSTITVSFPATDPEGGQVGWDVWIGEKNGASGACCYTGSSTTITLSNSGVYRIGAQAIDKELNLSTRQSSVVHIGGVTGEPPIASAALDRLSGPVPLTVNIDMGASLDPDGSIRHYFFSCGGGSFTPGLQSAKGICTFDKPGAYWIMLHVQDTSGYIDVISAYAVATPIPGPNVTPSPTVTIMSPADGSVVQRKSTATIQASVAPTSYGVSRVDFIVNSNVVCSDTTSPFSCTWQVPAAANKSYQIQANASDGKEPVGFSDKVTVTAR